MSDVKQHISKRISSILTEKVIKLWKKCTVIQSVLRLARIDKGLLGVLATTIVQSIDFHDVGFYRATQLC